MVIAVNPNQTYEYVLRSEKSAPVADQTVFILKPLTAQEYAVVQDSLSTVEYGASSMVSSIRKGAQELLVLQSGLRGWRNLKDADGKDIPFVSTPAGAVDGKSLDFLPHSVRLELSNRIMEEL